ncbi:hypothetical protein E2C01_090441 [Portunus trituberculatus]|uniref:Uncharacterized protein n=1 Tax=Portunus trituberculatus TaxID=210409 RepID=A0A5B7JK90_PORTR|nr:hypothetical protein [Portunus trituberculatus]
MHPYLHSFLLLNHLF